MLPDESIVCQKFDDDPKKKQKKIYKFSFQFNYLKFKKNVLKILEKYKNTF